MMTGSKVLTKLLYATNSYQLHGNFYKDLTIVNSFYTNKDFMKCLPLLSVCFIDKETKMHKG